MIEELIKTFLDSRLSVPAYLEKPSKPPEKYVLLEKTGGRKRNQLSSSTFAFQSYAKTLYETAKLNEELKSVVESLIELDAVSSVSLNSDYNYTDTETKSYRYQAVYDIGHY